MGGSANISQKWIQDPKRGKRNETKVRLCVQWNVLRCIFKPPNGRSQIEDVEDVTCLRISKLLLKEMLIEHLLRDNKHHHMTYGKNHGAVQNVSIKEDPLHANKSFHTKHHRTTHGR